MNEYEYQYSDSSLDRGFLVAVPKILDLCWRLESHENLSLDGVSAVDC